jgi:hypothetical protein
VLDKSVTGYDPEEKSLKKTSDCEHGSDLMFAFAQQHFSEAVKSAISLDRRVGLL